MSNNNYGVFWGSAEVPWTLDKRMKYYVAVEKQELVNRANSIDGDDQLNGFVARLLRAPKLKTLDTFNKPSNAALASRT
jgi:hypothetical protein